MAKILIFIIMYIPLIFISGDVKEPTLVSGYGKYELLRQLPFISMVVGILTGFQEYMKGYCCMLPFNAKI
jgi:hypothetical protein